MASNFVARVFLLFLLSISSVFAGPYSSLNIKQMYVLGDSLSDQGNLFAATSLLGSGVGAPALPASDSYYQGRFSNGEVFSGVLAKRFGVVLKPSLAGGNNFAFGGATTDTNHAEAYYPPGVFPWSLNAERDAFLQRVATSGVDANALFVVASGANDLSDALEQGMDPATTIAKTVQGIANAVLAFKSAGARNVLVVNVPNLGLAPLITRYGPSASAMGTEISRQFNMALDETIRAVPGVNIVRFDMFGLLNKVTETPAKFGFSNVTTPCYSGFVVPDPTATVCANPDRHLYWDLEHPTTKAHTLLADYLVTAVSYCRILGSFGLLGEYSDTNGTAPAYTKCLIRG
ncbi:MAG TPA: SGNH/GDSL hydrolase family protein [Burkholderiales bacterium]|nr:SGNH/GDSL hydrolase family protein [Burkholderiales bacterium]